ncbi:unnamed protein product [Mycena citricolor]|uniref:Carboxylic ester hydrolase n=1 Tax=Mycena citricolor TaxID=2018698 RepID=A0AAD2H1X2_9AGAR|nr:unnamed protein product [Mycena citricolor]
MLTKTFLPLLSLAVVASAQVQSPIFDLGYAKYQGAVNTTTNVTSLIGIRYAAPPVGDLRFRAPTAPANVSGVQSATVEANQCYQAFIGKAPGNFMSLKRATISPSEDCLFLNVFYPSDAAGKPKEKLPTLFWIHGGGYDVGDISNFDGGDIIRQANQGVVVVTIQYRLGAFGFLPGTATKEDGDLNAGILDQDFALRWVQQHISQFGGDPSKVTIWGESAGGGSVLQHLIANNGKTQPQLFRAAITSSSYLPPQYKYDDPAAEILFNTFAAQNNCTSAADVMSCLRSVDASAMATVNNNVNNGGFFGTFTWVPVVDGEYIVQSPIAALQKRKVNGQALLAIANAFEGTIFINTTSNVNASQYALELFPHLTETQAKKVGSLYAGLGDNVFQVEAIMGEAIFICPSYYLANAYSGHSWKGKFAVPPALHVDDTAYYWPTGNPPPYQNTQFINAFAQSFTSFIVNLDPNQKINANTLTPQWNQYDVDQTEMLFNRTEAGVPVVRAFNTDPLLDARCRFWNSARKSPVQW